MRRTRLFVVAAIVATLTGIGAEPAHAANTVETSFKGPGGWATITDLGPGGSCTGGGSPVGDVSVIHPTPLGGLGLDHPIIVWGNGTSQATNATCGYLPVLQHFASYGFVVVAVNSGQVGSGVAMEDALDDMIAANTNPSSIFYQHLDTSRVAAVGHSQGAVGAMNAALSAGAKIDSVMSISTPDREDLDYYNFWLCGPPNCTDVPMPARSASNSLPPTFFARATGLNNASPCNIDDWISDKTADVTTGWYPTTSTRPFAAATVNADPPPNQADCNWITSYPHLNPFKGLGYMTAWLNYQLWGSRVPSARTAFVGSPAEITTNTDWQGVTLQALP